jgi:hypothetical protein
MDLKPLCEEAVEVESERFETSRPAATIKLRRSNPQLFPDHCYTQPIKTEKLIDGQFVDICAKIENTPEVQPEKKKTRKKKGE